MRPTLWLLALALAGCGTSPEAPAGEVDPGHAAFKPAAGARYVIDAGASRCTAKVGVQGPLSAFGHEHLMALRDLSGEARMGPRGVEGGTVDIVIRAASLAETGEKFSPEERQKIDRDVHEQALEVSKHPQILLKGVVGAVKPLGQNKFEVRIDSQVTLHGVTKTVALPAEVAVEGNTLKARGEFSIRHSDFGIKRLSAAAGAVQPTDRISLTFDLTARRRKR
jgi:polyisoprenoid-binding protein YceI